MSDAAFPRTAMAAGMALAWSAAAFGQSPQAVHGPAPNGPMAGPAPGMARPGGAPPGMAAVSGGAGTGQGVAAASAVASAGATPSASSAGYGISAPTVPVAVAIPGAAAGAGSAIRVTSDTAEYCEQLAQLVTRNELAPQAASAKAGSHRAEIDQLAAEGHDMCEAGKIRGGLLRLRRALLLLRAEQ